MNKIPRLAVLLSGDYRFWPRASKYIFEFVNGYADSVDYYFATWNTTRDFWHPEQESIKTQRAVSEHDVVYRFLEANENLVDYRILPLINDIVGANYYQSYLANIANILKRRYELDHSMIYDQVIEIRPDLLVYNIDQPRQNPKIFSDFECLMTIVYETEPSFKRQFPEATDFYYQTNSFTSDILCERFYYRKPEYVYKSKLEHWSTPIQNHWALTDYVYARRINTHRIDDNIKQIAIRANFPAGNLTRYSFDKLYELQRSFLHETRKNQNL